MASNFTPQQIEQFLQEFFDVVGARQYVGARYVPIFGRAGEDTVEWDDHAPYEPLTVVMHAGVSYVSRRYVPAGIQITDTAYWVETYRFNAQVEQYRQEVLSFQGQIDDLRDDVESDYVPFPDAAIYPKYGTVGQVLSTLSDGTTRWEDPVVPSDAQAEAIITEWLDEHPEATTTVQDGAITPAKTNNLVMAYRGALPISGDGDLNHYLTAGYYSIGNINNLSHTPPSAELGLTGVLLCLRNTDSGEYTTQILITMSGASRNVHHRIVNFNTQQPYFDWVHLFGTNSVTTGLIQTGAVTPTKTNNEIVGYRGALPVNSDADLNHYVSAGYYSVRNAPALTNIPPLAELGQTGVLLCLRNTDSGEYTTQILITMTGARRFIHHRIVNSNTQQPYFGWILVGRNMTPTDDFLPLRDKKLVIFGDSRTWFDGQTYPSNCKPAYAGNTCVGYQQTVKKVTQCASIANQGVSGNTTIDIATRLLAADLSTFDCVIIAGGVNDFIKASTTTIGTIQPIGSTFDTDTVYGALQAAVEHVLSTYPEKKLYILVPAIAWATGLEFPYATAKVQSDVAELYNIPYLDLYKKGGITTLNRDSFYADDPAQTPQWWLHFNDFGNAWMGSIIGTFLNSN